MHVTFYAMTVYFYCITGYMDPLALLVIPWYVLCQYFRWAKSEELCRHLKV